MMSKTDTLLLGLLYSKSNLNLYGILNKNDRMILTGPFYQHDSSISRKRSRSYSMK